MTIVDRGLGQDVPAGSWEAVFYQATHDSAGLDVGFERNWHALAGKRRGAYHYARPGSTGGAAQASLLVNRVHALGWDHTKDLWMLDVEEVGLSGPALAAWITEFMETAKAHLGDRGFLYIGFPFYVTHVSHQDFSLLQRYRWWLPDYSVNDGNVHPIQGGEPFLPVLHQYTSNPFDKSRVVNATVWHDLFTPEVIVHQEFNPPLSVISETMFDHPEKGRCHVSLGPDGGAFCSPRDAFLGTVVGKTYFKGRKAARVVAVPGGYQIIASSGEKYGPKF